MKEQANKPIKSLALGGLMMVSLFGVVACGGGGGSDDGGGGAEPQAFSASSSGVASKGIIKSGDVVAEELDATGQVLATVGSGETDAKGAYSLSIGSNYKGGPLLLTIRGKADGTTKMVCDVLPNCGTGVDFGDDMPLDATFSMTSIIPPVANGAKVTAQITPFTHMAARRALAASTVDEATVKSAISEVNQIVGVNILDVPPLDITDDAQVAAAQGSGKLVYAAFVAGAGGVAMGGGDLQKGLDDMATAFEDGALTTGEAMTAEDLVTAVQTVATGRSINDSNLQQVINTVEAQIGKNGEFDPEPIPTATLTAVEQARSVVAQARAMGTSLATLEAPAEAFDVNLQTARAVLDANSQQLGDTLGLVLKAVGQWFEAASDPSGTQSVSVYDASGTTVLGTVSVTVTGSESDIAIAVTGADIDGVDVDLSISSASVASLLGGGAIDGLGLNLSGSLSNTAASMSLDRMALSSSFADAFSLIPTGTTSSADPVLASASISGAMTMKAAGATFAGNAQLTFVSMTGTTTNSTGLAPLSRLSLSEVGLAGEFSDGQGNRFAADASLRVNNAADFDTLGGMMYEPEVWVGERKPGDVLSAATYAAQNYDIVTLDGASYNSQSDQTCFSGTTSTGSYRSFACSNGDVLGAEAYAAGMVGRGTPIATRAFSYSVYGIGGGATESQFYGELQFPPFERADAFANVTLGLTLDLALKGYPDTKAVFTGTRDKFMGGNALLTLTHGGNSLTFEANVNKVNEAMPATGTLKVSTPDGASLMLSGTEGSALSGTLKVGTTDVGTVEQTRRGLVMVRYSDGTFETLQ